MNHPSTGLLPVVDWRPLVVRGRLISAVGVGRSERGGGGGSLKFGEGGGERGGLKGAGAGG